MSKKVRSRAPLRIGIAGGGTDVSPYCDDYTGYVLNATIDLYAYCTLEETDDKKVTLVSTDRDTSVVLECKNHPFSLSDPLMLHKATYNRFIRDYNNGEPIGLKMVTYCDAPVGSGLGASSTLVVAMIKAFEEFFKIGLDDYQIAHLAYEIERVDCKFQGGRQDQYSATFGGFNFMEFYADNKVLVNPLRIRNWIKCELESSLILHYTGQSRLSAEIIGSQVSNMKKPGSKSLEEMHNLKDAALKMKEALLRGNFTEFVDYLNKSWESKKKVGDMISNPLIDETLDLAMKAGALGGKVSGAGGGGFIMLFVSPEKKSNVMAALRKNGNEDGNWSSKCHFSSEGSQCWTVSK